MLPYLSALKNATVFKGALQTSMFTLLTYLLYQLSAVCQVAMSRYLGDVRATCLGRDGLRTLQ